MSGNQAPDGHLNFSHIDSDTMLETPNTEAEHPQWLTYVKILKLNFPFIIWPMLATVIHLIPGFS